jgi:hypothetical protein
LAGELEHQNFIELMQQQPGFRLAAALTTSQRATVAAVQSAELSSISAFFWQGER